MANNETQLQKQVFEGIPIRTTRHNNATWWLACDVEQASKKTMGANWIQAVPRHMKARLAVVSRNGEVVRYAWFLSIHGVAHVLGPYRDDPRINDLLFALIELRFWKKEAPGKVEEKVMPISIRKLYKEFTAVQVMGVMLGLSDIESAKTAKNVIHKKYQIDLDEMFGISKPKEPKPEEPKPEEYVPLETIAEAYGYQVHYLYYLLHCYHLLDIRGVTEKGAKYARALDNKTLLWRRGVIDEIARKA